jgi:hypothetical protein
MRSRRIRNNFGSEKQWLAFFYSGRLHFLIFLSLVLFGIQTISFVSENTKNLLALVPLVVFVAFFAGAAALMEQGFSSFSRLLNVHASKILAVFILFFALLVGYFSLTSLLISVPMSWVLQFNGFPVDAVHSYSLQNSNCGLALAVISWVRHLAFLVRRDESLSHCLT